MGLGVATGLVFSLFAQFQLIDHPIMSHNLVLRALLFRVVSYSATQKHHEHVCKDLSNKHIDFVKQMIGLCWTWLKLCSGSVGDLRWSFYIALWPKHGLEQAMKSRVEETRRMVDDMLRKKPRTTPLRRWTI